MISAVLILLLGGCTTPQPGASEPPSSESTSSPETPPTARKIRFREGWSDLADPPDGRSLAATAWTGRQLLVWSGYIYTGFSNERPIDGGYAFSPKTGAREDLPPAPLEPRVGAATAWTGKELLVWGGHNLVDWGPESLFDDGAAYDPSSGKWRELPDAPISARAPLWAWTGKQLLVVGTALRVKGVGMEGAAYSPSSDKWKTIPEAPVRLTDATAVWTGDELVIFGAALHGGNRARTPFAIGAAYDPKRNRWRKLPDSHLSPQASTAAWNGREMIAWDYGNRSQAYDPRSNSWRDLPRVPLDSGECTPESVSVGSVIVGDYCGYLVTFYEGQWRREESSGPTKYMENLIDRRKSFSGPILISAGDVVLVVVGRQKKDEWLMFSYRPKA